MIQVVCDKCKKIITDGPEHKVDFGWNDDHYELCSDCKKIAKENFKSWLESGPVPEGSLSSSY